MSQSGEIVTLPRSELKEGNLLLKKNEIVQLSTIESVNQQSKASTEGYLTEPPLVRANISSPDRIGQLGDLTTDPIDLWLTGTGTPADYTKCGPSQVLRIRDDVIIVDAGHGIVEQLTKLGIELDQVTYIFITHHHIDHIIDLGKLLMFSWVKGGQAPHQAPIIIGPRGTIEYVNRLFAAFDYDIRVRVPHHYDIKAVAPAVVEIADGDSIRGACWEAVAFRVDHYPVDQAFGYLFKTGNQTIVISGDTRPSENLINYAQNADVLIHEVIYEGFGFPEYHTLSTDVGKVAELAKVKKLVLSHLLPGNRQDQEWIEHAKKDYGGPVIVGKDLLKII